MTADPHPVQNTMNLHQPTTADSPPAPACRLDDACKSTCRWPLLLAATLIVLAGLAAYSNSFSGPFIYDDESAILNNSTIRQLWPVGPVLSPPSHGETVSGRPVLNLSFAINYAIHGVNVWGYHAANLAIHILNGLLLLGILRRTFQLSTLNPRFNHAALGLAFVIALLWTVHPLQTEAVTYMVQRGESQASLFYLLTLYSVIRGSQSTRAIFWYVLAVMACLLGVATKEVVCTAPLVVLFYDRTFLSKAFLMSLRQRWRLYVSFATSWALTIGVLWSKEHAEFFRHVGDINAWSYLRSQPGVILHYLRLSLWPHPLCFGYEWPVAKTIASILPPMLAVGFLMAMTARGVLRRTAAGFLGGWLFLILAPSSSIIPLDQLAFEHRMYLPSAAVVTLVVAAGYLAGQELMRRGWYSMRMGLAGATVLVVLAALVLGLLTFRRNEVYQSALSIWQDTVTKAPHNPYAHNNLGIALANSGRFPEAIRHYQEAVRLDPRCPSSHYNWGNALCALGRDQEAVEHYQDALRIAPDHAMTHNILANALFNLGRLEEAAEHHQESLRLQPGTAEFHINQAKTLAVMGRTSEAMSQAEQAVRIKPGLASAHFTLANTLVAARRVPEAIQEYHEALRIDANFAPARLSLSSCLAQTGRIREAIDEGHKAVRLMPDQPRGLQFVAWLMATHEAAEGGDPNLAVELADRALRLTGRQDIACLDTLAAAYASAGRFDDAMATANEARRLAESLGQNTLAQEIHMRLQLYRDRKPYREPAGTASKPSP